jgi:hypothetical protein
MSFRLLLLASLLAAAPARAAQPDGALRRLLDLSPERIAAFQGALRDFGADLMADDQDGLWMESSYEVPPDLTVATAIPDGDPVRVPIGVQGRDLVADEQFLIAGREEDFEDAARWWVERKIKGSDAAAGARGSSLAPRYGWNGGPVVGFRKGPVTVSVGADLWKVRWSRRWSRLPDWSTNVSAGENDGEAKVAFTIGRSLYKATTR